MVFGSRPWTTVTEEQMESMSALKVSIAVRDPAMSLDSAPLSRYSRGKETTGMMAMATRIGTATLTIR